MMNTGGSSKRTEKGNLDWLVEFCVKFNLPVPPSCGTDQGASDDGKGVLHGGGPVSGRVLLAPGAHAVIDLLVAVACERGSSIFPVSTKALAELARKRGIAVSQPTIWRQLKKLSELGFIKYTPGGKKRDARGRIKSAYSIVVLLEPVLRIVQSLMRFAANLCVGFARKCGYVFYKQLFRRARWVLGNDGYNKLLAVAAKRGIFEALLQLRCAA